MKKIMFNDKYGLTQAVLEGRKTMTRRVIPLNLYNATDWKAVSQGDYEAVVDGDGDYHDIRDCGYYKVGEEVAVAQSYNQINNHLSAMARCMINPFGSPTEHPGWTNKMFVKAGLMHHHIRIKDIKVERLQDISDEDCIREGIEVEKWRGNYRWGLYTGFFLDARTGGQGCRSVWCNSPQKAFAALIDRISGKGTWERNPWVFAYEFEKVD